METTRTCSAPHRFSPTLHRGGTPRSVTATRSRFPSDLCDDLDIKGTPRGGPAEPVSTMFDALAHDLREDIESRQDEMVALLEALVRAESPSVVPESQRGVQALLASSLCDSGFQV